MFYPSYEDYMRDIFYYNGLQQNMGYNYPYMSYNNQNLNNYYPSIYRIVNPIVQKVVNGNNCQFTNEESVNNMVETVLEIISDDISNLENVGNDLSKKQSQNQTGNSNNNSQIQANKDNNLLRDLIKILIIKELQSKQNMRRFPYSYGSHIPYCMQNGPCIAN